MATITLYKITASLERDGQILDCSQAEVLADAHGKLYTADGARAAIDDLESTLDDTDLDPTTTFSTREVTVEISDVEAEREDGLVRVDAKVRADGGPPIAATVYGADRHTSAGIDGLTPAGDSLDAWADADVMREFADAGLAVCAEILALAPRVASDDGMVVDA